MVLLASGYALYRLTPHPAFLLPGEAWARALLEEMFGVRPRWKEILGHGLLWMGGWPGPVGATARCLGVIAWSSMVNTFLHGHTPLPISYARTLWGVLLGGALGALAEGGRYGARALRGTLGKRKSR